MFSKLEFSIAMRYLRSKRKEGFISINAIFSFIGIMLGVATLIIVMSVMNGFRADLIERMLGVNAHISLYNPGDVIRDYESKIERIKEIEGVTYVNPVVEGQGMVIYNDTATGIIVKGIDQKDLAQKELIVNNLTNCTIDEFNQDNSMLIGIDIARKLGLKKGDKIKLIAPEVNSTMIGAIPRIKTYEVVGFFASGMYEYDSAAAFIPFETAQIHFQKKDGATGIEIFTDNAEDLKHEIFALQDMFYGSLYIVDWQKANESFLGALQVERNVMFIILTLIILVAGFNIISSLIMLVNDKKKNIALFRTMGASKGFVMRVFFICGSFIGVAGTIFGVLLGVLFTLNIQRIKEIVEAVTGAELFNPTVYFLSNLPARLFVSDVVIVGLMSLVISFLATLYPSYKATRTMPVEILRYD